MSRCEGKPVPPVEERIGHYLKRAEQALTTRKSRALRTVDLTVPQYTALLVLADHPGLSGAQLARRCYVTPQTMAALLANLETKALVTRTPSTVHSQVVQTSVTRHGRAVLRKADRLAGSVESSLAEAFSDEDRRRLVTMLTEVARLLSEPDGT